jgi:hypothetical protein
VDLAEMPALYDECESALEYSKNNEAGRVKGWRPNGIRLNEAASSARSAMVGVLASWCDLVVDQRGQRAQGTSGRGVPRPRQRDVSHMSAFLCAHLTWLTSHAAAAEFATEIGDVAAAARRAASPDQRARSALGPCAEPGCEGIVYAIKTIGSERDHQVRCEAGHVWQPHQWMLLGRWIEQRRSA